VTLVDTNVLLDLVTDDLDWAEWSIEQLEAASLNRPLLINDVVYAELSVRCGDTAVGAVPGRQSVHALKSVRRDTNRCTARLLHRRPRSGE